MANVTLAGNPINGGGNFPKPGDSAPDFNLTAKDLKDVSLDNVVPLSTLRGRDFHAKYGVDVTDGPLKGLTARAVVVLDENNKVTYSQLVPEIKDEPNYDAALAALR